MKKVLWTLRVNDYAPDICKLTFPLLEGYAKKIGAEFRVITERAFPNENPVYEKLQIYELGKDNDFNIFIDADCLIHPDFFDLTPFIGRDECFHINEDFSPVRFRPDEHFQKDGRYIGACNWFVVSGHGAHRLWLPPMEPTKELLDNINVTVQERMNGCAREHLIDDYILSRNISMYGLKHINMTQMRETRHKLNGTFFWQKSGDWEPLSYFWHDYTLKRSDKVFKMMEILRAWNVIT